MKTPDFAPSFRLREATSGKPGMRNLKMSRKDAKKRRCG